MEEEYIDPPLGPPPPLRYSHKAECVLCHKRMHTYRNSTLEPIKRQGICCNLKKLNAKNIFRKCIRKRKKKIIKLVYNYVTKKTSLYPLSGVQRHICSFLYIKKN